jgi:tetratricopeptide (TPR) repeat protein
MDYALAAYQRSDGVEAERLCRLLLDAMPDYFDALFLAGIIAEQTGRAERAVELLSKAVAVNPNDLTNVPAHIPYLHSDAGRVDVWRTKLRNTNKPRDRSRLERKHGAQERQAQHGAQGTVAADARMG